MISGYIFDSSAVSLNGFLIAVPLLAILLSNMIRTVRIARTAAREEEEKALEEAIRAIKEKKKEEEDGSRQDGKEE